jgi:hypothetical protein
LFFCPTIFLSSVLLVVCVCVSWSRRTLIHRLLMTDWHC